MSNLSTAQRLEVAEKRSEEVTGQLATASADLIAARSEVETLKGTVAELAAKVAASDASAVEAKATAEKATADLTALTAVNAELAAKEQDIEKRATAKAAAVVAVVGATAPLPLTTSKNAGGNSVSKLTLGEFNSLSQIEKNKFMSSGGKLSE